MHDILLFSQNHLMILMVFILVLLLLVLVEMIKAKQSTTKLAPAEVVQFINHQNAAILDLRSDESFLSGHIVDAISLPVAQLQEKTKKIEKFKSQPIVLVCASGVESARAATILAQKGFNPYILSGGMRAWREANMPIIKG